MTKFTDPIVHNTTTWRGVQFAWWKDHADNNWHGEVHRQGFLHIGLKPLIQDIVWFIDDHPELFKKIADEPTPEEKELYNRYTHAE